MFNMVEADALFPLLTNCSLPVRRSRSQCGVQSKGEKFDGEFVRDDYVNIELPDVGVFIVPVGEGDV